MTPSPCRPATASAWARSRRRASRSRAARPHPLELKLLAVPGHLLAVHERLHHLQRFLEVGHLHRLAAHIPHGRVAATDAHDHAAVRDVLQGGVRAREHRRVADGRVRDHVAELDRGGLVGEERHHRHRLPEHVRVVRPAVGEPLRLGELRQLDQALVRRIGEDGDAELEHRAEHIAVAGLRGRAPLRRSDVSPSAPHRPFRGSPPCCAAARGSLLPSRDRS